MKKEAKSVFSVLLMVLVITSLLSVNVSAAENDKGFFGKIADFFENLFNREPEISLSPSPQPFDEEAKIERINDILSSGKSATVTGPLMVSIADDFGNQRAEAQYFIKREDGTSSRLYGFDNVGLISGTQIEVQGIVLEVGDTSEIVVSGYIVLNSGGSEDCPSCAGGENPSLGEQRVAFVRVKFLDNQEDFFSEEESNELMGAVNDFYIENSYDQTWLNTNVYGYYTLQQNATCDVVSIRNEILNDPVISEDINWLEVDRLIIIWGPDTCSFGGMAEGVSMQEYETSDGTAKMTVTYLDNPTSQIMGVTIHELGHNFGVYHANDLECGLDIIYSDVTGTYCESIEYGDVFDVMGAPGGKGHFNAIHKETVGWFDPSNIVETNTWGPYTINPIETPGSAVKALKIPIANDLHYYVEFRRAIGADAHFIELWGDEIFDGAMLHLNFFHGTGDTQLLDNSPHVNDDPQYVDSRDVILKVGETFFDPINDVVLTTLDVTDDYLEVYLGLQNCGDSVIDFAEDCDGENLNEKTCWSVGYQGGELSCNSPVCRFDTSQCGERICGEDHVFNEDGSCTATFEADAEDNGVYRNGMSGTLNWDEMRHAGIGAGTSPGAGWDYFNLILMSNPEDYSSIYRVSIPFDTASMPPDAEILGADLTILLGNSGVAVNTHPESNDFVTLVPTTLANPPILTTGDFDQFSTVDNPEELANRIDLSELNGGQLNFQFVDEGLNYINKNGFTGIGLRGGYDLFALPNNGEYTRLTVQFRSANDENEPFLVVKPRLKVNYLVPITCNSDEECDDGIFCNGAETCSGGMCQPGTPLECSPGETCDEIQNQCVEEDPPATETRVFITSQAFSAISIGSVANADALCQNAATQLGGTWKAWISNDTTSASQRFIHSEIPYVLLNANVVASNWNDLTDGILQDNIDINELGGTTSSRVWTGTNSDGTPSSSNCNGWTSSSGTGQIGSSKSTSLKWTTSGNSACSNSNSLYCFEQITSGPECTVNSDCSDSVSCTTDICTGGVCVNTPVDSACNDGLLCTTDICDAVNGCQFDLVQCAGDDICNPNTGDCEAPPGCSVDADCDNSNACTTDTCNAGTCSNIPITCNDGSLCTTDSCSPASGCVFNPVTCNAGFQCNPANGNCEDITPPPIPTLSAPADGMSSPDATPTFSWTSVSDPSGVTYTLQVDDVNTFVSPVINQMSITQTSYTPTSNLAPDTYFWRVRAVDGAGHLGGWSSVRSFTIEEILPPVTETFSGILTASNPSDSYPLTISSSGNIITDTTFTPLGPGRPRMRIEIRNPNGGLTVAVTAKSPIHLEATATQSGTHTISYIRTNKDLSFTSTVTHPA